MRELIISGRHSILLRSIIIGILLSTLFNNFIFAQQINFFPEFQYYTSEDSIQLYLEKKKPDCSFIQISINNKSCMLKRSESKSFIRFSAEHDLFNSGLNSVTLTCSADSSFIASCTVELLTPKHYEVKINNKNGLVYINQSPFYPIGFYSYWPVRMQQLIEERHKAFNLVSPYLDVFSGKLKDRQQFLDDCASLDMKVNYNLLSITQIGGLGYKKRNLSHDAILKALKKEIETFKEHPAILSWYIADEAAAQGADPEFLKQIYSVIKQLDPYHPVSMVFMNPLKAKSYEESFDIVMADPYIIPDGDLNQPGDICRDLKNRFRYKKAVWMVPQAFGGNEWWQREPDKFEIRTMTYLSFLNEASGIQYFIRKGPNSFPKSTVAWNEASEIAYELTEYLPFVASDEEKPIASSSNPAIQFNCWKRGNQVLLVAQNTGNTNITGQFIINEIQSAGKAKVLFENREVQNSGGQIVDLFPPYSTHAYLLEIEDRIPQNYSDNLFPNPGFELYRMPGVPESCYAKTSADGLSFYSLDALNAYEGAHSLRLMNGTANSSSRLEFFPFVAEPEQSYLFSVYAKTDSFNSFLPRQKQSFWQKIFSNKPDADSFLFDLKNIKTNSYSLTPKWEPYTFYFTNEQTGRQRISPAIQFKSFGTAWFDQPEIFADPLIESKIRNEALEIYITSHLPDAEIHFTRDGSLPDINSELYQAEFPITREQTIYAGIFENGKLVLKTKRAFHPSLSTGKSVIYTNDFASNYSAGGNFGLVNGLIGTANYNDGNWQGFIGKDFSATISLNYQMQIRKISINFLSDFAAWIFQPAIVEFFISKNGIDWEKVYSKETEIAPDDQSPEIRNYSIDISGRSARYVKVVAKNIGSCPDWHKGKGQAGWLFTDEIVIE